MSRLRAVVAVLALFTSGAAFAQDVTVTPDVVYGHKYGMALTFDVWVRLFSVKGYLADS